jgi:hypothetical protein
MAVYVCQDEGQLQLALLERSRGLITSGVVLCGSPRTPLVSVGSSNVYLEGNLEHVDWYVVWSRGAH